MALTGLAAYVTGAKPDLSVTVNVDAFAVSSMLERTLMVLEGHNLETFLRGPAHAHFEHEIVQRFAHEGDKKSGPWPPLSKATENIRDQLGYSPDEINLRSNEMFDVLTHAADYEFSDGYAEMNLPGHAGTVGLVATKLRTAALGRDHNPVPNFGPTPPRPVLAVDETDMEDLLVSLNGWIIAELTGGLV